MRELSEELKFQPIFNYWDSKPPKGTLLVGEPGTGKTHSVRCLASELDCYLVEINYEDIASKYVDEPIEKLKQIKSAIETKTKLGENVIVFLDEVEILLPSRDTFGLQMVDRKKVNFFLTWLNGGLEDNRGVYFIAATNNEDMIDAAVKRAGRFEHRIEFNKLDSKGVIEVMTIHMALSSERVGRDLFEEINWDSLEADIEDLTGAEAEGIVNLSKRRKAQMHRDALEGKFNDFMMDMPSSVSPKAALEILMEGEKELIPPPISTGELKEAVRIFMEREKERKGGDTVVTGFAV